MKAETVELGEVCDFTYGDGLKEEKRRNGKIPVYGSNGIVGWHNQAITAGPTIIVGRKGSIGEVNWSNKPCFPIDTTYYIEKTKIPCDLRWLYYALLKLDLTRLNKSAAVPGLNRDDAYEQRIIFPSTIDQKKVADCLDQTNRLCRLRRYALEMSESFLPAMFIEMFGDPIRNIKEWPIESLGSLGDVTTGGTPSSQKTGMFGGKTPFITPGDLEVNTVHSQRFLTDAGVKENVAVRAGSTLVCCIGATIGKTDKARIQCSFNQQINAIEWSKNINDDFGFYLMRFFSRVIADRGRSTTLPILKKSAFEELILPVPPMPFQQKFSDVVKRHERLHSSQGESLRQAEHLFQSLLHQAFSEDYCNETITN